MTVLGTLLGPHYVKRYVFATSLPEVNREHQSRKHPLRCAHYSFPASTEILHFLKSDAGLFYNHFPLWQVTFSYLHEQSISVIAALTPLSATLAFVPFLGLLLLIVSAWLWVIVSCFLACPVTSDWMLALDFMFWGFRCHCIAFNIVELCFGPATWNRSDSFQVCF